MKRIKAVNGYTIYEATERDEKCRNVEAGYFYLFFSSDIRGFGLAYSDPEMECGSLDEAEEWAAGSNYAAAKEIAEAYNTAAAFEEIAAIETLLDNGMDAEKIAEAIETSDEERETVHVEKSDNLFFVCVERHGFADAHGPYFSAGGAENAAINYVKNTGAEYLPANY